ncbi:SIS domain-containing protein [Gammaproteobacteria bacterium]|nr:SIS domain-containing protein [Gammaproteobacteria bacterium]
MSIIKRLETRISLINSSMELIEKSVDTISSMIQKSISNNGKIMFCGNGGSAAESQHMAAEYCATLNHKNFRSGIPALSLTVDTSFITAWSNDFGYLEVFSRQIETIGNNGDILICYSTSGSSKNIVQAAKMAKSIDIKVVLFTGNNQDIGIKQYCDYVFHAPSLNTAFIQEIHTILGHEVCLAVENKLKI